MNTPATTDSLRSTRRLDLAQARHLLRRLAFGARRGEAEALVGRSLDEVVEELVEGARQAPITDEVRLLLPSGELEYLQAWWLEAMLAGPAQRLRERLALMWHEHFATSNSKVDDLHLMYGQNRLWRTHGLGDFRALLAAAVVDPAMLVWLDGVENRKGHPNENLARELMELFALGIGNYDEDDVLEAARGLSGWSVRERRARFVERQFDAGAKSVLGHTGALDAEGVVAAVLASPACSRWIAGRLWNTYMSGEPSDDELAALARELERNDWDCGRALVHLATSERFCEPRERHTRIAGPVEFVVRTTLELGVSIAPTDLVRAAAHMGQTLFLPPSVKGWDGGRAWLTSTAWIARQRFAVRVAEANRAEDPRAVLEHLFHDQPLTWRSAVLDSSSDDPRAAVAAMVASAEYQLQ